MAWFESWFNSPYYHILYQHRDEQEAERFLGTLTGHLAPKPGARILDLACGKGRHSLFLSKQGFEVTGVDLSPESIAFCRQFENARLSFFVHDMRKLFRTNDFDYVFNLFTSFGYFDKEIENVHAIRNACIALKPGGSLIIDFFNSEYVKTHMVLSETKRIGNINFEITKTISNGFLCKQIRFYEGEEQHDFIEKVQLLTYADFEKYLLPCGMQITEVFGDYQLHPFDKVASPRLILIARKEK